MGDAYFNKGEIEQARLSYLDAQKINDTGEIKARIEKCENNNAFKEPEMVFIKGDSFIMGCTVEQGDDCKDNEKPAHEVNVSDYYIGKYEVTFAEYDFFCEETKRNKPDDEGWVRNNRPVINVNWNDAQAYCEWLSKKTGKKYRLPTEAEWEYAARGKESYKYAGSNNIDELAWYNKNSGLKIHSIGQDKANGYGLYDMSGNVYEWCEDEWHQNYKDAPNNGSAWIINGSGNSRLVRGGAWLSNDRNCRTSFRTYYPQENRGSHVGFRLVQDVVINESKIEIFSVQGNDSLTIVKSGRTLGMKKGDDFIVKQYYTGINSYQTEKGEVYFILRYWTEVINGNSSYAFYQENLPEPVEGFSYVERVVNNFARIQKGGKWGFINYNGELIEPIYDEVSDFENGLAEVVLEGRRIKIDIEGECIRNCGIEKNGDCGCKDEFALNYNKNAIYEDGSCLFDSLLMDDIILILRYEELETKLRKSIEKELISTIFPEGFNCDVKLNPLREDNGNLSLIMNLDINSLKRNGITSTNGLGLYDYQSFQDLLSIVMNTISSLDNGKHFRESTLNIRILVD